MVAEGKAFDIEYQGLPASVTEHSIKNMRVWHILFTDNRKPLVITVALDKKDKKFWTSVPEGRQAEAEEVGKLIATHIRSQRKLNQ